MAYDTWDKFVNANKNINEINIEEMAKYDFSGETDIVPGRRTDADRTKLAFEIYTLLLQAQGCERITRIFNRSRRRACLKEIADNKVNKIRLVRYPRPGFLFLFKNKWCALEVDTLIGPKTYQDITGTEKENPLIHTIGNLGLVPFGSGYFTTYRFGVKSDYLKHKIEHSFEEGFLRPSGFVSPEELYDVMLYNIGGKGLCTIDRKSKKEDIDNSILQRGKAVIEKILTFQQIECPIRPE